MRFKHLFLALALIGMVVVCGPSTTKPLHAGVNPSRPNYRYLSIEPMKDSTGDQDVISSSNLLVVMANTDVYTKAFEMQDLGDDTELSVYLSTTVCASGTHVIKLQGSVAEASGFAGLNACLDPVTIGTESNPQAVYTTAAITATGDKMVKFTNFPRMRYYRIHVDSDASQPITLDEIVVNWR